jgi:hypothetical protein
MQIKGLKIKGRIIKAGNTYALSIRKALVDAELLERGKEYECELIGQLPELYKLVRIF